MTIVGIDPGTGRVGYAVLKGDRHSCVFVSAETIHLPPGKNAAERLGRLETALTERLRRDKPDAVSVEKLFFAKNAKTALAVAEARGIILLTASRLVRSIWECTPLEVKMAVTGYGRADKNQVRKMTRAFFPGAALPPGDDAIDAIAIALAGIYTKRLLF